jgi:hypothetical protein
MTKKVFLEILQKRLKQIDETNLFGIQYLEGITDLFWQDHAMNYFLSSNGDISFYTKRYNNKIPIKDTNGEYYLDLPEKIIRLPQTKNSIGSDGVLKIYSSGEVSDLLVPIRERDYYNIQKLPIYEMPEGEYYYYVKYDKIYFSPNLSPSIIISGVDIDLMIPFSSYLDTEDLPIPTDMRNLLFVNIINFLTGQSPPDLLNNNSND